MPDPVTRAIRYRRRQMWLNRLLRDRNADRRHRLLLRQLKRTRRLVQPRGLP